MTLSRLTLACALAAITLSPAQADDVSFTYQANELETPETLEALLERIEDTAEHACRKVPILPPHYGGAIATCENNLITDIVSGIDDARLYVVVRQELGLEFPNPDAERLAATE
jgi:UrcA family protein